MWPVQVEVDELDGEIDHRDVFLGDVERALLDHVHRLSLGNPLFVKELGTVPRDEMSRILDGLRLLLGAETELS